MSKLSEKEKSQIVSGKFLKCVNDFSRFKKGESYWLEYVGHDKYCGRSDNILGKYFKITPDELVSNFEQN